MKRFYIITVLVVLALLCMTLIVLPAGDTVYWMGGWDGSSVLKPIGICLTVDGLARLLLATVNMVAFVAVVYSIAYMRRYTNKALYYSLFFLMLAGMNGVVLTGDMFNLYVFLEVASIASYALVAYGCESEELEAYVAQRAIDKYNITGRQLTLYLEKLDPGRPARYEVKMKARFPLRAKTPESRVYQYYNPDILGMAEPIDMVVEG